MKRKPIVAVVGRPNVGKSTFVNRLVGARQSIVDDLPGVTRDRLYFDVTWQNKEFTVIDTGGIIPVTKTKSCSTSLRRQKSPVKKRIP